jgi:two-component system, NtrC family, sensor histidine kinase HydH
MSNAPTGTRWARWGLLAATFAMGVSLLLTSWSSYRGAVDASATLTRGQGEALLRSLRVLARREPEPLRRVDLEALLNEQASLGLRYVAVLDERSQAVVDAGSTLDGQPIDLSAAAGGEPVALIDLGPRVRMIVGRPPAPPGSPAPAPSSADGGERRRRPLVAIEFEPLMARQLSAGAARTLSFGAATAAGLMIIALLFSRLMLQREAAERRLQEQRRLAALGEMSSVLAHELRNPLASLKGHAQLLAEHLPEQSRDRRKADRIVVEAERLEALSADLLDFSRTGPIDRRDADPAALLAAAAESIDASRVALSTAHAPRRWSLDGDRMIQVLTNLLANALQASAAGEAVEATAAVESGALVFEVRDHGVGIPAGDEARIFEPFYTTRTSGTGLGLAVAQRIVEMHGGTIVASNAPDGGARFCVTIPKG